MNQFDHRLAGKKVLLSPLGSSQGLLYTALMLLRPDLLVTLTSKKFEPDVMKVIGKAGLVDCRIVLMHDVFVGFDETESLVAKLKGFVNQGDSVSINLTGGTTAMQWVMQAAFESLRSDSANVKRVAFIDRRDSNEQKLAPWIVGEIYHIDK